MKTQIKYLIIAILASFSFKINAQTKVKIETNLGNITLILYNETPKHRDNFIKLINENFYDDLLFHRVIKDFMIQGGDPDSRKAPTEKVLGLGGPGYTIVSEINETKLHFKGALAAARLGDQVNPNKESSGSQFYIVQGTPQTIESLNLMENQRIQKQKSDIISSYLRNPENKSVYDSLVAAKNSGNKTQYMNIVAQIEKANELKIAMLETTRYTDSQKKKYIEKGGTPHLDFEYTVFGEVIEGFDVIEKISNQEVDVNGRPKNDILMKVTIVK